MGKSRLSAIAIAAMLVTIPAPARPHPLDHLKTNDDIGLHKIPHSGVSHVLVVPVRVGPEGLDPKRYSRLLEIFDPKGGPGTFRHYWKTVSGGRYDPIPTLANPVLYPDECPIPGRSIDACRFSIDDLSLIANGGVRDALGDVLRRVRDESGLDLSLFDVNGAQGKPDGHFDGLILDTNIYNGVGFPLAALRNEISVGAAHPSDTQRLTCGIVALIPPSLHEFGHLLGFVDLYGGPSVAGLMGTDTSGDLSAFSRQQIGWGEVRPVTSAGALTVPPALDGGPILRFGEPPRYVLVENRGGPHHSAVGSRHPAGLYVYSVDEQLLPDSELGFLDIAALDIYLPNAEPPYLNVNLPVGCRLESGACALRRVGERRDLVHASGEDTTFSIEVTAVEADGTVTIDVTGGQPPDVDQRTAPATNRPESPRSPSGPTAPSGPQPIAGGCAVSEASPSAIAILPLLLVALARRQRRRTGRRG